MTDPKNAAVDTQQVNQVRHDTSAAGEQGRVPNEILNTILVVGLAQADLNHLPEEAVPSTGQLHFVAREALTPDVFEELRPRMVLTPLIARKHDASELARHLNAMTYRGIFRVLTPKLPRPDMVLSEIRKSAPGVMVDFVPMSR